MTNRDILTDPQWVAFQAQLDAQPDSHDTRAVLADWLEGFGHPWARTYRWMARMKKYPADEGLPKFAKGWYTDDHPFNYLKPNAILPLLSQPTAKIKYQILSVLQRVNAEVRLCELFDELPLVGKEEFADV